MGVLRTLARLFKKILQGYPKIGIVSFEKQGDAIACMLKNIESVEGFLVTQECMVSAFQLKLYEPSQEPYQTADGKYLSLDDVPQRRKAGRPVGTKEKADCLEENIP